MAKKKTGQKKKRAPESMGVGIVSTAAVIAGLDEAFGWNSPALSWVPGASVFRAIGHPIRLQLYPGMEKAGVPRGLVRGALIGLGGAYVRKKANKAGVNPVVVRLPGVLSVRFL